METLFPSRCLACGVFFQPPAETFSKSLFLIQSLSHVFCPDCAMDFLPVNFPRCSCCGLIFQHLEGPNHVCGTCHSNPPAFARARSFGVYEGALLTVIHKFKYNGKTGLSVPLGMLLFDEFRRWMDPEEIDIVVPVPLHIRRFRKRGYNQAYLLIRNWPQLADEYGMDGSRIAIGREALVRARPTAQQVGLNRSERRANMQNAFLVSKPEDIAGQRVLLIDDVMTTGTTAGECARSLLAAGAKQVDLLTLARAQPPLGRVAPRSKNWNVVPPQKTRFVSIKKFDTLIKS